MVALVPVRSEREAGLSGKPKICLTSIPPAFRFVSQLLGQVVPRLIKSGQLILAGPSELRLLMQKKAPAVDAGRLMMRCL